MDLAPYHPLENLPSELYERILSHCSLKAAGKMNRLNKKFLEKGPCFWELKGKKLNINLDDPLGYRLEVSKKISELFATARNFSNKEELALNLAQGGEDQERVKISFFSLLELFKMDLASLEELQEYGEFAQKNWGNSMFYREIANCLLLKEHPKEAKKIWKENIAADSDKSFLANSIFQYFLKKGQFIPAIHFCQKYLDQENMALTEDSKKQLFSLLYEKRDFKNFEICLQKVNLTSRNKCARTIDFLTYLINQNDLENAHKVLTQFKEHLEYVINDHLACLYVPILVKLGFLNEALRITKERRQRSDPLILIKFKKALQENNYSINLKDLGLEKVRGE